MFQRWGIPLPNFLLMKFYLLVCHQKYLQCHHQQNHYNLYKYKLQYNAFFIYGSVAVYFALLPKKDEMAAKKKRGKRSRSIYGYVTGISLHSSFFPMKNASLTLSWGKCCNKKRVRGCSEMTSSFLGVSRPLVIMSSFGFPLLYTRKWWDELFRKNSLHWVLSMLLLSLLFEV